MSARKHAWFIFLCLLAIGCGEDDRFVVEFAPGALRVRPFHPVAGEPVTYSVGGSFALVQIYQDDTLVSQITLPNTAAVFVATSAQTPRGVAWGNSEEDRSDLVAVDEDPGTPPATSQP